MLDFKKKISTHQFVNEQEQPKKGTQDKLPIQDIFIFCGRTDFAS